MRSVLNLIEALRSEYDFFVVTRNTDYTSEIPYADVKSDQWNLVLNGIPVYYISSAELNPDTIAKLIQERHYDHVYLNSMWSQAFTLWPLAQLKQSKLKPVVTLAVRGMLAPSALEIKKWKKKLFLLFAGLKGIYRSVRFHATNETEAEHIRNVFGLNAEILIAPNLPRTNVNEVSRTDVKQPGVLKVVTVARIAPEKNILYGIELLNNVRSEVEYNIYGAVYDEAYFDSCKRTAASLPGNIKVNFNGPISSEQIHDVLSNHHLMLLASRGENFGHIILEAMQSETPVLISDQTPWQLPAMKDAGWVLPLGSREKFTSVIETVASFNEGELSKWRMGAGMFARNYSNDSSHLEASRKLFL